MFFYRKENALSPELCKSFIDSFEASEDKRPGVSYGPDGTASTGAKKSTDITFHPQYRNHPVWGTLLGSLVDVLERGLRDYRDRHSLAFSNLDPLQISSLFNLQRYDPGEGFYGWHCERATNRCNTRYLVWILYLNTITDRGETEFYYQHHFESAIQGKLVIWPSDWMYLHRGVPSPSQTKYILTGWYTMIDRQEK